VGGRRRVSDTAITNLCAGSRSIGLPATTMNFVNIEGMVRHYWQNILKYIVWDSISVSRLPGASQ
jgi:hypothetical protein